MAIDFNESDTALTYVHHVTGTVFVWGGEPSGNYYAEYGFIAPQAVEVDRIFYNAGDTVLLDCLNMDGEPYHITALMSRADKFLSEQGLI